MKKKLTEEEIKQAKQIACTYITHRNIIHFPYRSRKLVNHDETADQAVCDAYYTLTFEITGKAVSPEGEIVHQLKLVQIQ